MKDKYGAECKICTRPFTVFRWCPGQGMRYKRTDICQTCAKLKNCCQTCIFDLEFGVPLQLRDKVFAESHSIVQASQNQPKSELNREFYMQQLGNSANDVQKAIANPEGKGLGNAAIEAAKEKLRKLGRQGPYYKRNAAKICTFWVKGMCKRGEECPYRHEKPTDPDDPLSKQNRRDRYFGTDDPVADKLWARINKMPDRLKAPKDMTIKTLFVRGVTTNVSDNDINSYFYQFGPIQNITIVEKKGFAFVEYERRQDAERAMTEIHGHDIMISGENLSVRWGKGKRIDAGDDINDYDKVPGLPNQLPTIDPDTGEITQSEEPESKRRKGVAIPPPQMLQAGQVSAEAADLGKMEGKFTAGGKMKKGQRKRIGGRLEAVSSGSVHYPSQNPDRMGGYID